MEMNGVYVPINKDILVYIWHHLVETGSPCCAEFTSTDGPKGPSSALCCVPKMGQRGSLDVDGTM